MDYEQLFNLIKKRRSIRNYLSDPISDEDLNKVLEAGLYAPSGKNRRPWRFVIVRDEKIIQSIAKATSYSQFAGSAPVLVLVFTKNDNDYPLEKDMISIGACLQNMMLTITAMGYGSCIIGELFKRHEINTLGNGIGAVGYSLTCGLVIGKPKQAVENVRKMELDKYLIQLDRKQKDKNKL